MWSHRTLSEKGSSLLFSSHIKEMFLYIFKVQICANVLIKNGVIIMHKLAYCYTFYKNMKIFNTPALNVRMKNTQASKVLPMFLAKIPIPYILLSMPYF